MIVSQDQVHAAVRSRYAQIARSGCGCSKTPSSCRGGSTSASSSIKVGYGPDELASVPEGADMGLGCGNPQAIAALRAGETVLDLGSGVDYDRLTITKRNPGP